MMNVAELNKNQWGEVIEVGGENALRRHLLDLGIIPGAKLCMVGAAPMGDPVEILLNGYSLTLRREEAAGISVRPISRPDAVRLDSDNNFGYNLSLHEHNSHPGLGEGGRYHSKDHESPLPKDSVLTFAIVGQHNCGKTSLFNAMTGSSQHVGNFPGVTVDRKDGKIKGHPQTVLTDLPGIISLLPYSSEENVTREFLLKEKPECIINVADTNNIERSLYLTIQLMELDIPVVLALNMMDELRGNGGSIRVNEMERILGIPVVTISAAKNEAIDELVEHAVHIAKYQEKPARNDFCSKEDHGGAVHRCLHGVMHLIEDHAAAAGLPVRFAAGKLIEGDSFVMDELKLSPNEKEMIEHIICQMEEERGLDRMAAIADMRYSFINRLCGRTVVKPARNKEYALSRKMDKVLTGKWTAIPIFAAIMALIIWLTIDVLGAPLQKLLERGIRYIGESVGAAFSAWNVSPAVSSLVVDGIFGGVGTVVSFVPIIIVLFFFLSMLEDSGYMARVAFITDKLLRKTGLSGRSIVPLLIGLGCSVPGVMASRTLPSARDRKMTVLLTPYFSCSAKIPLYVFLSSAFFPGHGGLVLVCLYLLGIGVGVIVAVVSKHLGNKSQAAPFVMELPNYRLPQMKNVAHLLWDKCKDFLQIAFTIILIASVVIWFLQSFNFKFEMVENGQGSMLAWISGLIAPVFKPLGLGDWRIVTALISGFMGKENIVSSMKVLGASSALSIATAVPMLVFCLLYTPCVAAIASIKRELGRKWASFIVVFQCVIAWIAAFIAYQITLIIL